eukprot:11465938-Ditylum_brightwellii.AAC.1
MERGVHKIDQEIEGFHQIEERRHDDKKYGNVARKIDSVEAPKGEYKLLVGERRKRKRFRKYRTRKRARKSGRTWKANETEINSLGFVNVPDQIWRNKLSKGERNFVASFNAKRQHGESIKNLTIPRRFEN